jgi:hypothetical protein
MKIRISVLTLASALVAASVMPSPALTVGNTKPSRPASPKSVSERPSAPARTTAPRSTYKKKGHNEDLVLLVVPARRAPVQMAQDMMQIRDNCLVVSYNGRPQDMDPEMFFWSGSRWVKISANDYSKPSNYKEVPEKAIIFGTRKEIPGVVIEGLSWVDTTDYVDKLDVLTMVKAYDSTFDFSEGEWNALAKRYGLVLKDNNAGKSRYGVYSRKPDPMPVSTMTSAPMEPMETIKPQPLDDTKPVEPDAVPTPPDSLPERSVQDIPVTAPPIADLEPDSIDAPIK